MKKVLFCLFLTLILGCQKKPKVSEVRKHLSKAMTHFLYASVNNDSSRVKFLVKDVIYFEEADFFECEFTVDMKQNGKDTTGIMKARINKDFTQVSRKL
ncbi:MAG: hypothetical protein KGO92_00490 [Bacteroidota bacterium]|nr:hypothetical protein [Bacteroidota bacterium]